MTPFHISVVLAMSADGKIADAQRSAARFSSPRDLRHLEQRIAQVDGVLLGGGTLRAYGTTLPIRRPDLLRQRRQRGQPDQPLHIVCSPSGDLSPALRFFDQPVPRGLITTPQGASRWRHQPGFDHIWAWPQAGASWDWRQVLAPLATLGLRRLALLGGGRLVAALVQQGLVDEVYLTLCPLLLGGDEAPTPVDGTGFLASLAPRLTLISCRVVDQEVYVHYRVQPPGLQAVENSITLEHNPHPDPA